MSTINEDEDACSEDYEEKSDDEGDDDDVDDDNDTDGVIGDPKGEPDNGAERSRKSKDTKLVSTYTCFCCESMVFSHNYVMSFLSFSLLVFFFSAFFRVSHFRPPGFTWSKCPSPQ